MFQIEQEQNIFSLTLLISEFGGGKRKKNCVISYGIYPEKQKV